MAISFIADTKYTQNFFPGTTPSVDTTGANFIVIICYLKTGTSTSFSDNKGNTYTTLITRDGGADQDKQYLAYCANAACGSGHTFTTTGGQELRFVAAAFSGVAASSPADTSNTNGTAFVSSATAGSITPSENNELLITCNGGSSEFGGTVSMSDGSYTRLGDTGNCRAAYFIQGTAAAKNPTWANTVGQYFNTGHACFKQASGGASPIQYPRYNQQAVHRASRW